MPTTDASDVPSREQLLFALYEAAELEHDLMCTYLYAAFSLRQGEEEGLSAEEAPIVAQWRRTILDIAIEEMGHLTAVWNITAALGGAPRFGRFNFPLEPGVLPAGIVVKLAPFSEESLQHFVHLERPEGSKEADGEGFVAPRSFRRDDSGRLRLTPTMIDYETVGTFYACLTRDLRAFVERHGEAAALCGDPAFQLSSAEVELVGANPVLCSKTAFKAIAAIVEQGEGALETSQKSHFSKFLSIRRELSELKEKNPAFSPAYPAATNPVLRRPLHEGRVWLENDDAAAIVDLANAGYGLMLRLMAYSYVVPRPSPEKALAVDLGLGLMRAVTLLAEHAARLPAGASYPGVNAGMSFTTLREAASFPHGRGARHALRERFGELAARAETLAASGGPRTERAARILADLYRRAQRGFEAVASKAVPDAVAAPSVVELAEASVRAPERAPAAASNGTTNGHLATVGSAEVTTARGAVSKRTSPPVPVRVGDVDHIESKKLTLLYEGKKCIHARFCVTGAPSVFLANVQGPWIDPDAVEAERLVEIAHACPSGAIRYRRHDGKADESAPPVNLLATRENGPYAVRGDLKIDGEACGHRATLCRCGASKNKPYCDGSHNEASFRASGEPPSGPTAMLDVRDGPLAVDPELDGPLVVRGNLEITSGTGRVVARLTKTRLCRCGASESKPFCDRSHLRIGFRST